MRQLPRISAICDNLLALPLYLNRETCESRHKLARLFLAYSNEKSSLYLEDAGEGGLDYALKL